MSDRVNTKKMKTASEHNDGKTYIVQPSVFKPVYELRTNGNLVVTMKFPRPFRSLAEVEGYEQRWEFYKPSFWKSTVEVRQKGFELPVAKYIRGRWGRGGTIELPRGDRVKHTFKILKNLNEITSESGTQLITFRRKNVFRNTVIVQFNEQSEIVNKYPWIVMLVWYVILHQGNHSGAY
jgi:hypothetical protein